MPKSNHNMDIKNKVSEYLKNLGIDDLEIKKEINSVNSKILAKGSFVCQDNKIDFEVWPLIDNSLTRDRFAWKIAHFIAIQKLHLWSTDSRLNELYNDIPKARNYRKNQKKMDPKIRKIFSRNNETVISPMIAG